MPADGCGRCFRADAIRFLLAVIDSTPVLSENRESSRIHPLISEMRRCPEGSYPVERLIAQTQMSESSLASAFRRETGQTPHEFLVICRIRKAMDILARDPSVRITNLVLDLGFASSQHFAARFRRETGKTPSEYRAQR